MTSSDGGRPFVGVVSDTHGYYDERLDEVFAGAVRIIHAGDVGAPQILTRLGRLAPVTAVAGNTDFGGWGEDLPWETEVEVAGLRIIVCHIGRSLMGRHDPVAERYDVVVSGHSHRAAVERRAATLFVNPGAAARSRLGQPCTCALVAVEADGRPQARIVTLDGRGHDPMKDREER